MTDLSNLDFLSTPQREPAELPFRLKHLLRRLTPRKVANWASDSNEDIGSDKPETVPLGEANVICSDYPTDVFHPEPTHALLLDIDFEFVHLIPSTTPGHFHLYVNTRIKHADWVTIMAIFAKCGLIEEGYAKASINRGYASLRTPWSSKTDKVAPPFAKLSTEPDPF